MALGGSPGQLTLGAVCSAATVGIIGYWPLRSSPSRWVDEFADDAFYYFVIARRIAEQGLSSFDGVTRTNGYQPLWQAVVSLQVWLFGSIAAVMLWELAALAGGTLLVLRTLALRNSWMLPLSAALVAGLVVSPLVLIGMETSILFLAFAGFVLALKSATELKDMSSLPLAITAGLVIAARLDAGMFVVPVILIAPLAARRKLASLLMIAAAGVVYASANQVLFGVWLPISGMVKSLGIDGLNNALLGHLASTWSRDELAMRTILGVMRGLEAKVICLAVGTAALALALPHRRSFEGSLAFGLVLGFALFAGRLVFFSSWTIWDWYAFPIFFFLVADLLLIAALAVAAQSWRRLVAALAAAALVLVSTTYTAWEAVLSAVVLSVAWGVEWRDVRIARRATFGFGLALIALCGWSTFHVPPRVGPSTAATARALAPYVSVVTGRQPIAIGDRAGAFAWYYEGSVHQLEGLVNDRTYLERVRRREPIEPLLCERGVRFILSFEGDLGSYDSFEYRPYQPALTTFDGPRLRMQKADEVLSMREGVFLGVPYLWRLPGCPTGASAASSSSNLPRMRFERDNK